MEEATAPLDAALFLVHAVDWLEVPDREGQTALQACFGGQLGDPIESARGRAEVLTERPEGARFAEWTCTRWVLYPWPPWSGHLSPIRDVVEKACTDRARCALDGAAWNRWQEVRLWMFGCTDLDVRLHGK